LRAGSYAAMRDDSEKLLALAVSGDFFLRGGFRLESNHFMPARILAWNGAGIDISVLDFKERLQAQLIEIIAQPRLDLRTGQELLDLLLGFVVGRLPGFGAVVNAQDQ